LAIIDDNDLSEDATQSEESGASQLG
jgi:hypothetical protein